MQKRVGHTKCGNGVDGVRPIVAASAQVDGAHQICSHTHPCAQLLYTTTPVTVQAAQYLFISNSQSAVWIPPGMPHAISTSGSAEYCSLFIAAVLAHRLGSQMAVISMPPLLRSLMYKASEFGGAYQANSAESRLIGVLHDELQQMQAYDLSVPLPHHPRLRQACEAFIAKPDCHLRLADIGSLICSSTRTVERFFCQQLGISFGQWQRRVLSQAAVQMLLNGRSVQYVAMELGYTSASGFISMFKATTGLTPKQHLQTYH